MTIKFYKDGYEVKDPSKLVVDWQGQVWELKQDTIVSHILQTPTRRWYKTHRGDVEVRYED